MNMQMRVDHVADKAAAVAEAVAGATKGLLASERSLMKVNRQLVDDTKAMRAELVVLLRYCMGINCFSLRGWIRPLRERQDKAGNRLVELGEYESMERDGLTYYRPIELRDSGESDAH